MSRNQWTRRSMLKASAAVTLPALLPAHVLGLDGSAPPSETVRVGVIGCGGRARCIREGADVKGFQVVAAADCELAKAERFAQELSGDQKWGVYEDYRQMIDREKLDAVMVETTTHARGLITIVAMQAGLDVYIEKPMCLTIAEGRAMVNAARKLNRVTQVGTQQRSMPINNWASDLVKNGAIGKIKVVLAPNFVGPFRWTKSSSADVTGPVDKWWDIWTSQAEMQIRPAGQRLCQLGLGTSPAARWQRTIRAPSRFCSKSRLIPTAIPTRPWVERPSAEPWSAKRAISIPGRTTTAWLDWPVRGPR